jgi:CHAD domain-containing protein
MLTAAVWVIIVACAIWQTAKDGGAFTHTIPAGSVRQFRRDMLDSLADARRQVHEAQTHEGLDAGRSHLDWVCDMLDGLGWEDKEPEVDVPVDPIREALRRYIERSRPRMESHDAEQREDARVYVKMCENLLAAITP